MWKQLIPLFVVAVLVGWFMPAGDPVAAPAVQASGTATPGSKPIDDRTPRKPNLQSTNGPWTLVKQDDGHFYAEGTANGQTVRFLVDTGASTVALTDADAQRLGLFWNYSELQNVGRGVSGEVTGKPVEIPELRVGGMTVYNVRAVIIPQGLDVSLLGQSFLSKIPHVGISGDRMTLSN
jgi:aspartyl protease family protein